MRFCWLVSFLILTQGKGIMEILSPRATSTHTSPYKLIEINVNSGQEVSHQQKVCLLASNNVVFEVVAPKHGIIYDFQYQLGDTVKPETVMMLIRDKSPYEIPTPKKLSLAEEVTFLREENFRLQQLLDTLY